jgi:photosystem II stability/assembly factor-like uncharacterized protein
MKKLFMLFVFTFANIPCLNSRARIPSIKKIGFILLIFLCSIELNAQNGWYRITLGSSIWYYGVKFTNSSTGYVVGSEGTIIKTTNAGFNFYNLTSGTTVQLEDIFFVNQSTGYIVGSGGIILKTTNEGNIWTTLYPGGGFTLYSVFFTDANYGHAVGAVGIIRSTTNGGQSWDYQTSNTTLNLTSVFFTSRDTGYIGGLGNQTMLKTTNRGVNWFTMPPPGSNNALIRSMCFVNSTTGIAGGSLGKVYKTTNSGGNWTEIQAGTSYMSFEGVCFANQNTGYFISSSGILLTTNTGENWITQYIDFNPYIYAVHFINAYTGYTVGENGGIWKTTTGGGAFSGIETIQTDIPSEFKLYQNFPNPFNSSTKICFDIPQVHLSKGWDKSSTAITIKVFNMLGSEVSTLVNEDLIPGKYKVDFHSNNYPSGIYFYKLMTDRYTEIRKMIILK